MTQERILYYVWYTLASDFRPGSKNDVMINDVEKIYAADKKALIEMGFSEKRAEKLSNKSLDRPREILEWCKRHGCAVMSFENDLYPSALASANAPVVLYVKGNVRALNGNFSVGVVGTRSSTPKGEELTRSVVGELVKKGVCIVSGGADGIDTAALKTALNAKGSCVAVMGCDIDKYYPSHNFAFFQEMQSSTGAVISEYPPGTNARWFADRNRIIAGLSDRVFVPEAPLGSGALITAEHASRLKVPVITPNFEGDSFEGCRQLIGRGAVKYESPEKITERQEFVPLIPLKSKTVDSSPKKNAVPKKSKTAEIKKTIPEMNTGPREYNSSIFCHIAKCIKEGRDIPDKMCTPEFPMRLILSALTELEIKGEIENIAGNRFIFKR